MDKIKQFVGIDISKDTFDVYCSQRGHGQFLNQFQGFKSFIKTLEGDCCCVMEATGSYHYQLALFLYQHQVRVSVLNPLVIKRFRQMKLSHTKTDKSDAKIILHYAQEQPIEPWEPEPLHVEDCKMLQSTIDAYFKQSTALKNLLHSLLSKGTKKGELIKSLNRQLKQLKKEIDVLEKELEGLIKSNEPQLYTHLTSIPGIGKKTALLLIACTNGFKRFESSGQLSAYFGLAPTQRRSGTSIRGRSRISKAGNPKIRHHLFLCSFTACKCNPQCRALYNRIVAKGKSKKLALIAVANKLLKQAYGIAKSEIQYDPHYRAVLAR